jgi:Xaa-Pro aminopeptidase
MLKSSVHSVILERRQKLQAHDPDACFVFFGASEVIRNDDVHFPFRQNSTFFYLTEFDEPNAALVLVAGKSYLFVQERSIDREIWDGERYGFERAKTVFQVDETFLYTELYAKLEEFIRDANKLYYELGAHAQRDSEILKVLHNTIRFRGKGSLGQLPIWDPTEAMANLRMVKDAHELSFIRKACSASARAHLQVMKRAKPGMTEHEVAAEFRYAVSKSGCTDLGYETIAASGYNATTLHYNKNNDVLKLGDLFLMDAGGELGNYTADITQTFPVAATFSPEQKQVYQKVLEINREVISLTKPGISYRMLYSKSVDMITEALLSLGVLTGSLKDNLQTHAYRKFYPHGLGHYLGLDVHDAGIYVNQGRDFELKAGMLMTNEPGLYFRERGNAYFGIGVRIEDDLLLTETACENLTHELPREVEAIEQIRTLANS